MTDKKLTYNQIILKMLEEYGEWIPSYQFVGKHTKYGWLGISAGRRLRELAEAGRIERQLNGKYVEYRAPEQKPKLPPVFKQGMLL